MKNELQEQLKVISDHLSFSQQLILGFIVADNGNIEDQLAEVDSIALNIRRASDALRRIQSELFDSVVRQTA